MRLTLRTLLAYLDNTLEAADAEALRQKLTESGFATQLVSRIRASLVNANLSAPSPNAVNPIEEANVISEYLDSTLESAQVAEIERACLESDPHLAEAAACHQVLTMVLGKPADVTDALRQRIYALPDRAIDQIATSGSFSGVSVPDAETLTGMPEPASQDDAVLQAPAEQVEPVGLGDSGVFDAAARLRDSESLNEPALAGSSSRDVDRSDLYGGRARSSRIVPWLVSLALAGVLLFALSKIFAPLIGGQTTAQNDRITSYPADSDYTVEPLSPSAADIEVAPEDAPIMKAVGTPGVDIQPSSDTDASPTEASLPVQDLPAPDVPAPDVPASDLAASIVPVPSQMPASTELPEAAVPSVPKVAEVPTELPAEVSTVAQPDIGQASSSLPAEVASGEMKPKPNDLAMADVPPADPSIVDAPPADPDMAVAPMKKDVVSVDPPIDQSALATAKSSSTLIMAMTPDGAWKAVKQDMMVNQVATLLNAPKFRSKFAIADKINATFIDASRGGFTPAADDSSVSGVKLDFGRMLLTSNAADVSFNANIAGYDVQIGLPHKGSSVAIEVIHTRRPGFDPFVEDNHVRIARVLTVASEATVSAAGEEQAVEVGKQWFIRGKDAPKLMEVPKRPSWLDAGGEDDSVLDESAREGLLAFLEQDQSLSLSLREATSFRKGEVASLAAQVLLLMGNSDVYFGTDGVLSQPKQRMYFGDHYRALLTATNRDAESAKRLREEISKMDAANNKAIFRLLTGYSTNQLVEGADEDLVEFLDSNSMAVRIFAIENLREITGTTLNFRPEEDNAVRRAPAIKKWKVRQIKGDIKRKSGK